MLGRLSPASFWGIFSGSLLKLPARGSASSLPNPPPFLLRVPNGEILLRMGLYSFTIYCLKFRQIFFGAQGFLGVELAELPNQNIDTVLQSIDPGVHWILRINHSENCGRMGEPKE